MDAPVFSVIIGRVSTVDADVLFDVLRGLRAQSGVPAPEIVLADRTGAPDLDRVAREYPEVRLLRCARGSSLPTLRSAALRQSRGRFIVVTEDHCIPNADWLYEIGCAFAREPGAAIVTGPVINGATTTTLDWATYLFEYAAVTAPLAEGWARTAAGMNVAYRRGVLESARTEDLEGGFWEHTIHRKFGSSAGQIYASQAVIVQHRKKIPLAKFLSQRFLYSRHFAGTRFPQRDLFRRACAAIATPVLVPLLLGRLLGEVRRRSHLRRPALRASILLCTFAVTAAAGECCGYVTGAGDSLHQLE